MNATIELSERPRERLFERGSQALSEAELVALLLRTGTPGKTALEMAAELLANVGGLTGLAASSPRSIHRRGLGKAKVASLMAALEVARRVARAELRDRRLLDCPEAVARYLAVRYCRSDQEMMGALYLDTRHRLRAEAELFRGTLTRAAVEPRAVLKEALLQNAAGLILFHTHPSGDPSPSSEDVAFTKRLAAAAEIVGVRLVDHLVIGSGSAWVSLKRIAAW